ncbi:hypothetical protein CYMTET_54829 [Cymbomonas tetramitiformis]|uniref:RNA polymerase II-associated protein 3 n=1 Tax=Cymbomonas tetramitiformis TaxID=36881 RepID=A0AAE0BFJ8_9CHLO|nr:hypothetical protein CYMTET_54829 [Cymbomonas tetramitiformis]
MMDGISSSDRRLFDLITTEDIGRTTDVDQLTKMEAYMRSIGLAATQGEVARALKAAGGSPAQQSSAVPSKENIDKNLDDFIADIENWPPADMQQAALGAAASSPKERAKAIPDPATEAKDKGNAMFREGKYIEAEEQYSRSLEFTASAVVYSNRSICRLKIGRFEGAEADASAAIAKDGAYAKGFLRRAQARRALGKKQAALEDFLTLTKMQPSMPGIDSDIRGLREELAEERRPRPQRPARKRLVVEESDEESDDEAATKSAAPPATPAPARKRLVVEESDEESDDEAATKSAAPPATPAPARKRLVVEESDEESEELPAPRPTRTPSPAPVVQQPAESLETKVPSPGADVLKSQGNALFAKGDIEGALKCYTRSLELRPDNTPVLANRAAAYLKLSRFQEAEADCSAVLMQDASYVKVYHRRALARKGLGKLSEAAEDMRVLCGFLPQDAQVKQELNELLHSLESSAPQPDAAPPPTPVPARKQLNVEESEDDEEEQASEPRPTTPARTRLVVEESEEDEEEADADADQIVVNLAAPGSRAPPTPARKRLVVEEEEEDDEPAVVLPTPAGTRQGGARDEEDASQDGAPAAASRRRLVVEESDEEDEEDEKAVKAAEDKAAVGTHLSGAELEKAVEAAKVEGNALFAKNDIEGALKCYTRSLELRPDNTPVLANRAAAFLQKSFFTEAEADCTAALHLGADERLTVKLHHRRAVARRHLGSWQTALEDYEVVSAALPGNEQVLCEMQEVKEAEQQRRAAEHKEQGNSRFRNGDFAGAIESYSESLQLAPASAATFANRAAALLKLGRSAEAEEDATQAIERDASYVKAYHRRAQARRNLGQLQAALEDYEVVLRGHPDAEVVQQEVEAVTAELAAASASKGVPVASSTASPTRTRLVVEESDEESEEEEEEEEPQQSVEKEAAVAVPPTPGRTRLVVEDSDEEDEPEVAAAPPTPARTRLVVEESEEEEEEPEQVETAEEEVEVAQEQVAKEDDSEQVVEAAKVEGNALFAKGDIEGALKCYTRSLELRPDNAPVHANRAAAYLKGLDFANAELDCSIAIELQPGYIKAHHRRAVARRHIAQRVTAAPRLASLKRREAQADYKIVQDAMPDNQQIMREIEELKADHQRVSASESVDDSDSSTEARAASSSEGCPAATSVVEDAGGRSSGASGARPQGRLDLAASKTAKKFAAKLGEPKSALDFERGCKVLAGDPNALATYIKDMDPESYPHIFKDALTGEHIRTFASTLRDSEYLGSDREASYAALQGLTRVSRFTMAAMLLSRTDRTLLRSLIDGLKLDEGQSAALKVKYQL